MKLISESFPKQYKPHDHQVTVLKQLDDAIKAGYKFIILQAPTGSGKSMFASAFANAADKPTQKFINYVDNQRIFAKDVFGQFQYADDILDLPKFGAYTLTVTKQLQNQYSKLFDDQAVLKGKVNYQCSEDEECNTELAPCMVAPKLLKKCLTDKCCPYYTARDKMLKNNFAILNYSMFLCLPDHVKQRQVIICDEASELEDELVKYYSLNINYFELLKFYDITIKQLLSEDRTKAFLWLCDLQQTIKTKVDDSIKSIQKKKVNNKTMSQLIKHKKLLDLNERVSIILNNWTESEYIVERDGKEVSFSPLYVDGLAKNIFKHADHIILMSATIIDHKTFAKSLGINEYKYIEVDSIFDPEKSPIYCPGKYSLSYANIDKNISKVVDQALEICKEYKSKKGIIHTHNFKITEAIQKKSNDDRFLFREEGINNELILDEHFSREDDTVLVSPSLSFGTDLVGKYGEFQIIVKLPFLPLGSKRIKILSEKDKNWYIMKMFINLIQMSGRCTRNVDDAADTFILDGQAFNMLKQYWSILPKHFKERLV